MIKVRYLLLVACFNAHGETADTALSGPPLPSNVVARINGEDIPGEWFLHEFRSTFFRYPPSDDVRQDVLETFIKRMVLAAKARAMGLDQQEDLRRNIEKRTSEMRAFMDYQLEMARISMLNEALLKELNVSVSAGDVTGEELEQFFADQVKDRPGAPASLDLVPAQRMEALRAQAAQAKLEQVLDGIMETWRHTMTIEVNREVVESVPFPEMKGTPPPGFQPRTSD